MKKIKNKKLLLFFLITFILIIMLLSILYKYKNYTSFNFSNVNPKIFGPPLWRFLHIISFNYPHNPTFIDKLHYRQFLFSLINVIPCESCKLNYKTYLKNDLKFCHFKSKDSFSKFIYDLHNKVNLKLGKSFNKSFYEVKQYYNSMTY